MASLDDILTTQKNGVVAVNALNQTTINQIGAVTSVTISAPTVIFVGSGRLVNFSVIEAGSNVGGVYNNTSTTGLSPSTPVPSQTVEEHCMADCARNPLYRAVAIPCPLRRFDCKPSAWIQPDLAHRHGQPNGNCVCLGSDSLPARRQDGKRFALCTRSVLSPCDTVLPVPQPA